VQTTAGSHNAGELEAIADFAYNRLAAKVWNLYFLVPTGRGQFVSDMTPAQYDDVLASLYRIQGAYQGRMLVNAKCAPHYIKTVLEQPDADTRPIRTYSAAPAAARRARTTWESARTGTSRRARICLFSRDRFAARALPSSGPHRSSSPASGAAPRSVDGAANAR
jgi:MoaA/NifB/PqqE/SkfB family radical SAM enzyme